MTKSEKSRKTRMIYDLRQSEKDLHLQFNEREEYLFRLGWGLGESYGIEEVRTMLEEQWKDIPGATSGKAPVE